MTDEPDSPAIPGTRGLPDNAIHRASLWLERLKFGERAFGTETTELENFGEKELQGFLREVGLEDLTERDLLLASHFYGGNMRRALFGDRIQMFVPNPAKGGEREQVDLDQLFGALWLDAFQHGAATALRKYGYSAKETASEGQA